MNDTAGGSGLQLRSLVKEEGVVEVTLVDVPIPQPGDDEVIIRVEAAPINPSDLGLLFAGADLRTAAVSGPAGRPTVTATIAPAAMPALAGRVGQAMPVGNEGAGVVIAAGASPAAQALLGETVAVFGGSMYAQHRRARAAECLVLPPGTTPAQGAACFVNPLTALGMTETMRLEGHTALVHTAAASNLGQMLHKLCAADEIPLVNIVRRPEQVALLRGLGAEYVCDSSTPSFTDELTEALVETGATIAFDAIGGGRLAGQILQAMEAAAIRKMPAYSRYGSTTYKQVYLYGRLDPSPTELTRTFGFAWRMGGWLLTPMLEKIGAAAAQALRERVAAEITTTFASSYAAEVSLADALSLDAIAVYGKQATGEKYLIAPHKG